MRKRGAQAATTPMGRMGAEDPSTIPAATGVRLTHLGVNGMFTGMDTRQGHAIETMQVEKRRFKPSPEFSRQANAQPDIYERGTDEFWTEEANRRISWFQPWQKLYEWKPPYAKWYIGGRLNVCYNCVDRHVECGLGNKVAYFWEGEAEDDQRQITFGDLQSDVVRFANGLKKLGVKKGSHIGIYMGMVPELPVAMLACSRIGAAFTVV